MTQHAVVPGLFDVEDFALQRQNRLEAPVAALFGGAAGRFTFDEKQLAAVRIALLAIRQLAGQPAGIERAFAPRQIAGFAGRFSGARRVDRLRDDLLHHGRILFEELAQFVVDQLLDLAGDIAVQAAFGLAFELRLRNFHADDGGEAFAHVVAGQILFDVFEQARTAGRKH